MTSAFTGYDERYIDLALAGPLDPMNVLEFEDIIVSLASMMKGKSKAAQKEALKRIAILLSNPPLTEAELQGFATTLQAEISGMAKPTASVLKGPVGRKTNTIYKQTKHSLTRRFKGFGFGVGFNAKDHAAAKFLRRTNAFYVRNAIGGVAKRESKRARGIVADGILKGHGRREIGGLLHEKIMGGLRTRPYMDTLASLFSTRARSYSQMNSYQSVGVQRFLILAILDERTTDTCEFLNGRTFSVGKAINRFQDVEGLADPQEVRFTMPFINTFHDAETGEDFLGIMSAAGNRLKVADIIQKRGESRGEGGRYRQTRSDAAIQDMGVGAPPYHHRCRTDSVPIES